jgi:phosphoglycolate phosphatase
MIRAAIFDLDGTVLDTVDDLADSMNEALVAHGLPTHSREAFFHFVGNGVMDLVRRTLPEDIRGDEDRLAKIAASYRESYQRLWNHKTTPYPGISEMLERLQASGLPMAVLSNKPQHFTELCIRHYFPQIRFEPLWGQRDTVPRKPDPTAALDIAQHWGLSPSEIAFVGDTDTDMKTATNAGMFRVGVTWGFRNAAELREHGADVLCGTAAELEAVLGMM